MKITEQAKTELQKALNGFDKVGAGIRIYSTHGCCGPSIQMSLSPQMGNDETALSESGIEFFISKNLISDLENITIEYNHNGFKLITLNNNNSCCG